MQQPQVIQKESTFEELIVKYSKDLKELSSAGFTERSKTLKLLLKTNGNVEIVKRFLEAKKRFSEVQSQVPKSNKRLHQDLIKVLLKEDSDTSSSSSDNEDNGEEKKKSKKAEKELKKQEKNELKLLKQKERESKKDEKKEVPTSSPTPMQTSTVSDPKSDKLARKEEKRIAKEEREKTKLIKKQEKEEKKAAKEAEKEKRASITALPDGIEDVYIDGNNHVYVVQSIRSMVLGRAMSRAESALQLIAQEWHKFIPEKKVTLVFDDTNKNISTDSFHVCSAKPFFSTSDDALVSWASKLSPEQAAKTLVFTSDRELTNRLESHGVQVLKSKCFFKIAALKLGQQPVEGLDAWSARWLDDKKN